MLTQEQLQKVKECPECEGRGYFEYETGVVSEHIPYIKEIAKEPCDCVLQLIQGGECNVFKPTLQRSVENHEL